MSFNNDTEPTQKHQDLFYGDCIMNVVKHIGAKIISLRIDRDNLQTLHIKKDDN